MENDYDVLGNIENINSVHILKKFAELLPTLKVTNSEGDFQTPEDDLEALLSLGQPKGPKTRKNATSSRKISNKSSKSSKNQQSEGKSEGQNESTACTEEIEQSVARRTRSSRGRASLEMPQPSASSSRTIKTNKTTKSSANNKSSKNSTSASDKTAPDDEHNNLNKSRPKRGRKKTTNAANSTNVLDIDTEENDNDELGNSDSHTANARITRGRRSLGGQTRDVMRARRNYIAERAARCTTVDFVDLANSPMPRVLGVIDVSLDSDEDECFSKSGSNNPAGSLNMSFDEDNPELSVKIIWQGSPEVFTLRKYQKFESVFELLAEREKTEVEKIFLNLENKIIVPTDTPASINYKIFQFLYGRIMEDTKFTNSIATGKPKRDPNLLTLKVQSDKWKHPLKLQLNKTEKFKKLVIKCAEELKMSYDKIKLSFDGEPLQYDQTPNDLEFEGGEVLEIHLKDNA